MIGSRPSPAPWLRAGLVVALAGAGSACSFLLSGTDFTGGADTADATFDGPSATDVLTPPGDAGTIGVVWDASAGPFCSTRSPTPTFCLDFDTSVSFDDRSAFHSVNGYTSGGVAELDKASFASSPASLHLGIPAGLPGVGSGLVNVLGYQPSSSPQTAAHFECDLRVDAIDAKEKGYLVWFGFGPKHDRPVSLYTSQVETGIKQDIKTATMTKYISTPLTRTLPLQAWAHLDVDFAFSPSGATATVKIDGVVALDAFQLDPSFANGGGGQVELGPGYFTTQNVVATEAHFDNVLVQLR